MMDINVSFNDSSDALKKNLPLSPRLVSVYTVLLILRNMRDRLGIEAMTDFLERYTKTIERVSPQVKDAVNDELLDRALHGLYEAVCHDEK
jgi:hypothetical protein